MTAGMQLFDAESIRARLSWPRMLAALEEALRAEVEAPLRAHHRVAVPGEPSATLLAMPAWRSGRRLGVKLCIRTQQFHREFHNPEVQLAVHQLTGRTLRARW